jgi:hypothetical protein
VIQCTHHSRCCHIPLAALGPVARGLVARELQGLPLAIIFNAVVGSNCPHAVVALLDLLHQVRVVLGRELPKPGGRLALNVLEEVCVKALA